MVWEVMFTCDICGKHKGDANHWWMATVLPASGEGRPGTPPDGRMTLMRWSRTDSQSNDVYHLCGQGCAMQAVERFMTEGALDLN